MPHPQIKFGTDGWRGVIADDFTFANVRTAAEAIAAYVHAQLVLLRKTPPRASVSATTPGSAPKPLHAPAPKSLRQLAFLLRLPTTSRRPRL